ncbi:MAG: homocysteine S-methyltransferase family protein, partial [Actinobacteria bacterium]|nr:homocysteine S-methyltransferase family protein [Actinomycetota bacterium]
MHEFTVELGNQIGMLEDDLGDECPGLEIPAPLELARQVAAESGALFAGDICNTNVFVADDESRATVRDMFEEQVGWAVDAGVDFVIGETFSWGEEALIALDVIKAAGV